MRSYVALALIALSALCCVHAADEVLLNHDYYLVTKWANSSFVDITTNPSAKSVSSLTNGKLSLKWAFNFYGHKHDIVYIMTYGMIRLWPHTCESAYFCFWSDANEDHYDRYIAPYGSDFVVGNGSVTYLDTGSNLKVQWTNVSLGRSASALAPNADELYSFQVEIQPSGLLRFHYARLGKQPTMIVNKYDAATWVRPGTTAPDENNDQRGYPLVVGLEDTIIRLDDIESNYQKYGTLDVSPAELAVTHGIYHTVELIPHLTCPSFTDCTSCIAYRAKNLLQCSWCAASSVCSDGNGREIAVAGFECALEELTTVCTDPTAPTAETNLDSSTVAIGAAVAISVCIAGIAYYVRNKQKEAAIEAAATSSITASTVAEPPRRIRNTHTRMASPKGNKTGYAFEDDADTRA